MADEWKQIFIDAGVSPEVMAEAEKAFSIPELQKAVSEGVMRKTTYARKVGEVNAKERELGELKTRIESEWERANAEYLRMQTDVEATTAEKQAALDKAKELETKLAAATQIDPGKFVSREDFEKSQREYAAGQSAYFGDVLDIVAEHQSLFGARLSPKQLMQQCIEAKKTPMEFWEEKYNVSAKREEIAKANQEKQQQEWEKKGYEKRIAEEANPATRDLKPSTNPFYVSDSSEGKQPWDDDATPASETALVNALQAARG